MAFGCVEARTRFHEYLGIRVLRSLEYLCSRCAFNDHATGKDCNLSGQGAHQGELVGDEDQADTLLFEDPNGNELVKLQTKAVAIRDKMKIERVNGPSAVLTKDLVNIVRDEFTLTIDGGRELRLRGNFLDHEYEFFEGSNKVGEVSKKWFRIRDTYGVQIEPGYDDILLLAATVAMDQSSHDVA